MLDVYCQQREERERAQYYGILDEDTDGISYISDEETYNSNSDDSEYDWDSDDDEEGSGAERVNPGKRMKN